MARQLIGRGHSVTVVCGSLRGGVTGVESRPVRGIRRGNVDGIEIIEIVLPYSNHNSFVRRGFLFLAFAARSTWIALTHHCDLVFATSTPLTAAIPGIAAKWLRGRKFVFEVRDLWPELPRAMGVITNPLFLGVMSALEWLAYHSADFCIGLAPGIVDGIARRGILRSRIRLISNAADLDLFPPGDGRSRTKSDRFVAVFTGTHGIANGLTAVLDAAAVLKRRGNSTIELHFIGDGMRKSALQSRATQEGLTNCHFHPPQGKLKLADSLRGHHVGLMILANVRAFYYGTSPNKFFDYLACGMPVLCNYPGWVSELIARHQCGIVVPPDAPESFADALELMASEPRLCESMGVSSRRLAATSFDRRVLADEFCDVLEDVGRQSAFPAS